MSTAFYVLSTNLASCLNELLQFNKFFAIRKGQPDSGPFLDRVLASSDDARDVKFVLFDRVPSSDTKWKLVSVYRLIGIKKDEEESAKAGKTLYSLDLEKERDLDTPLDFWQGTPVWESLDKTRGKKTASFFNGARVLLPISSEDFGAIAGFVTPPETPAMPELEQAGVSVLAERELHAYLEQNLEALEPGLQPFDAETYSEFPTSDGGRIDLFCGDQQGIPVVVELKRGRADDVVAGQLARYIGWAKQMVANGGPVRGIIVANVVSERLKWAACAIPQVKLVSYEVHFSLNEVKWQTTATTEGGTTNT